MRQHALHHINQLPFARICMRASVMSPVFYFLQEEEEEGQKHEDAEEREAQGAAGGAHMAAEQRGSRRKIFKKTQEAKS